MRYTLIDLLFIITLLSFLWLLFLLTGCSNTALIPDENANYETGCKIVNAGTKNIFNTNANGVGVRCTEKLPEGFCLTHRIGANEISIGKCK